MAETQEHDSYLSKPLVALKNRFTRSDPEFDDYIDEGSIDLRHYWYVVTKYKWGILSLVFAVALFTTVWAYSMQPIYQSSATLMLGGHDSIMDSKDNDASNRMWQDTFFGTQYAFLTSREIAKAALERLKLDEKPWFDPLKQDSKFNFDWSKWIPTAWFAGDRQDYPVVNEPDPDEKLIQWLQDNLTVEPVRDTAMIKVSFENENPGMTALVANAIADAYIETHKEQRIESTKDAADWLKEQLAKSQKNIVDSINELQKYREDAGLIDVEGMQNIYSEQLRLMAGDLSNARRERAEAENIYQRAKRLKAKGQMDSLPVVLDNPWVQRLRAQEQDLDKQIRLESAQYQGAYPGLDEARENLRTVKNQISAALEQIVDGLKSKYEVAVENVKQIQSDMAVLEEKVQDQTRKGFQADALEKVVMTNRQSYDAFLSKLMETSSLGADTVSSIAHVVDQAVPNYVPVKPKKLRMIALSIVLSLMAGLGVAFLLDKWDSTFKTREDVEEQLNLPVLGELVMLNAMAGGGKEFDPGLAFIEDQRSVFAESIRTIRTGVSLSGLDSSAQVIVVTSTMSGEGKSTVAMNLALSMGQLGNVLLVDADMRRPTLAKRFGMDSRVLGLADFISGTAKVAETIQRIPGDIHLLPAGSNLPPDPQKILSSDRFHLVLQKMGELYDTVIIDSAPIEMVSDAQLLAKLATGLVYVVKSDDTPRQAVRQGINTISHVKAPILGIVLNQIDPKKVGSYGKYKYGYYRYSNYSNYGYSERT
jgi:capsular exopolysaccharide synthesis family protein